MRRSEILIWFLGPALGVVFAGPALLAQDCNGNGVDDAVDVDARRMDFGAGTSLRITEMENRFVAFHQLGDFDGNGDTDLVAALRADASGIETDVVLVRNSGDGSFEEPERIATGDYASGLAAADFSGDGDLDLALSFLYPGELMLLLGEGDGTFPERLSLRRNQIRHFDVADFDADGAPDIALLDINNQAGFVLFNEEEGRYRASDPLSTGSRTLTGLLVIDVDGDGLEDFVLKQNFNCAVFFNEGERRFSPPEIAPPQTGNLKGDLNGDGLVDLVTGNYVMFNIENGLFDAPQELAPPVTGRVREIVDLDANGTLDLITTNDRQELAFYLNDGDASFRLAFRVPLEESPRWLRARDLNGDGRLDLLFIFRDTTVTPLLQLEEDAPLFADIDENRVLDVCQIDCNHNHIPDEHELALGIAMDCNQNGVPDACDVAAEIELTEEWSFRVDAGRMVVADFDEDGGLDIAYTMTAGTVPIVNGVATATRLFLLLNDGGGSFGPPEEIELLEETTRGLGVGDFSGDGHLDLITWDVGTQAFVVLVNDGIGFPEKIRTPTSRRLRVGVLLGSDLDGDGVADLVVDDSTNIQSSTTRSANVLVLMNPGDGRFDEPQRLLDLDGPQLADLDGDGAPDLIASTRIATRVRHTRRFSGPCFKYFEVVWNW